MVFYPSELEAPKFDCISIQILGSQLSKIFPIFALCRIVSEELPVFIENMTVATICFTIYSASPGKLHFHGQFQMEWHYKREAI